MINNARKKMLERVKAILAKTMENGCTEEEAMTALAKARELMATYEIDEKELSEFDRESATFFKSPIQDPYQIKFNLGYSVGKFCNCEAWREKNGQRMFCGLESDIVFATWLLDTLQRFVMRALRKHQAALISKGAYYSNNLTSASFVMGCVARINEKLKELTPNKEVDALIVAELEKKGIVLRKARNKAQEIHESSFMAGEAAGANARFDKPVGAGARLQIK